MKKKSSPPKEFSYQSVNFHILVKRNKNKTKEYEGHPNETAGGVFVYLDQRKEGCAPTGQPCP